MCVDEQSFERTLVEQHRHLLNQPNTCFKFSYIIVDGTGNNMRDFLPNKETGTTFSNVLKIHLLGGGDINNRQNDVPGQIMLYQRGIGGDTDNNVLKFIRFVRGSLKLQTIPMRRQLEAVYKKGDSLYIIGYSRGAASARRFVSELDKKGLTTASGEHVAKPEVKFIGCFETVSMQVARHRFEILLKQITGGITNPGILGEKKGKMSEIVKTAVHNVALDDNRYRFGWPNCPNPPVFMDSKDERVHEVWFSGEHGDVGCGFYQKGLSDESLKFMQEFMEKEGVVFINAKHINDNCLKVDGLPDFHIEKKALDVVPNPADINHSNWQQTKYPSHRPTIAITDKKIIKGGTVRVHRSVLDHMIAMEKKGIPYKYNKNIKDANFVVVGALDMVLDTETNALKEILSDNRD